MLEKWKKCFDKGKVFGALLTDRLKGFDCLDHELLTAKLNAYGFSLPALRAVHIYLSNIKQNKRILKRINIFKNIFKRIEIENTCSTLMEIIFRVPQGSILGPLLLNIFLADLFFYQK